MFSLAIYTQAAVTNRLGIFSLFLLSLKAQRYFFKKVYNFLPYSPALPKQQS